MQQKEKYRGGSSCSEDKIKSYLLWVFMCTCASCGFNIFHTMVLFLVACPSSVCVCAVRLPYLSRAPIPHTIKGRHTLPSPSHRPSHFLYDGGWKKVSRLDHKSALTCDREQRQGNQKEYVVIEMTGMIISGLPRGPGGPKQAAQCTALKSQRPTGNKWTAKWLY